MKKIIFTPTAKIALTDFDIVDYSISTDWKAGESYFRRQAGTTFSGYIYKTPTGSEVSIPLLNIEGAGFNIENFSLYSSIVSKEKMPLPESTDSNTMTTDDGIVVIFFNNSIIIYDLFMNSNSPYTDVNEEYILDAYRKNITPLSYRAFIGFHNEATGALGALSFKKDVIFSKDGYIHYFSTCRLEASSEPGVTIDDYGYFKAPITGFKDSEDVIELEPKQYYSILGLSDDAVIEPIGIYQETKATGTGVRTLSLKTNKQILDSFLEIKISSTQKEYFKII